MGGFINKIGCFYIYEILDLWKLFKIIDLFELKGEIFIVEGKKK